MCLVPEKRIGHLTLTPGSGQFEFEAKLMFWGRWFLLAWPCWLDWFFPGF